MSDTFNDFRCLTVRGTRPSVFVNVVNYTEWIGQYVNGPGILLHHFINLSLMYICMMYIDHFCFKKFNRCKSVVIFGRLSKKSNSFAILYTLSRRIKQCGIRNTARILSLSRWQLCTFICWPADCQ